MLRAVAGDGSALPAPAFCWVKPCKLPVGCFAGRAGSVYILPNCSSQLWAVALQAQASLVCHWCCWCFIFMGSLTWIGQLNLTSSWWSNYQNNKPIYLLFLFFFSPRHLQFLTCVPLPSTLDDLCSVCPLFWHFDMCERGEMALKAFCWRLRFFADLVAQWNVMNWKKTVSAQCNVGMLMYSTGSSAGASPQNW